ncbi:putative transcriptional regulatory protein [Neolecta irregularis DAH-3]|uniref:Putative transcriptional regulatory protein n=1 Tax=Neolecta irregularis (strain DAH-3) TaxID=1198029 RepID=A0A1U7LN30_NEOID|nr:putative transcriptional regulatory protein [Neolecta irregularis DAH-3]|eukprot:OLL23952.1 putative transcriptional regulatory protein [Neolecta irregularis DAH-3]
MSYYPPELDLVNTCSPQYSHYHFQPPSTFPRQDNCNSTAPRQKRSHSDGDDQDQTSVNGGTSKRKRIPQSCIPCRLRKAKCDRKFPCGCCKKRREDSKCKYEDPSTIVQDHADLMEELQRTQEELARVSARSASIVDQAALEAALTLGGIGKCPDDNNGLSGSLMETPESTNGVPVPHFYLASDIQEADPSKLRRLVLIITKQLVSDRRAADLLMGRFIKVHPAAHFLIPFDVFQREYEAFWKSLSTIDSLEDRKKEDLAHRPFWPAVLLALFAVAVRSYARDDDPEWMFIKKTHGHRPREYRELLLKAVTRILLTYDYLETYDLDVITILVLNQYNGDIITDKLCWVNTGILGSMARGLSLHSLNPGYSETDNVRRQRLWDAVQGNESLHAWEKSIPTQMDLCELEKTSVPFVLLSPEPSGDSFGLQWAQYYYRLSAYFSTIYKFIYQASPSYTKAIQLDKIIRANVKSTPSWLEINSPTRNMELSWKKIIIEATINRLLLAVHLPFVRSSSQKYNEFHKKAIEAAKKQMQLFNIFRKKPQELAPFSWFANKLIYTSVLVATLLFALEMAANKSADQVGWQLVSDTYTSLRHCDICIKTDQSNAVDVIIHNLLEEKHITQGMLAGLDPFPGFDACGWKWAFRYILKGK